MVYDGKGDRSTETATHALLCGANPSRCRREDFIGCILEEEALRLTLLTAFQHKCFLYLVDINQILGTYFEPQAAPHENPLDAGIVKDYDNVVVENLVHGGRQGAEV